MKRIIDNPRQQDHTQTYGEYCVSILTPEYRQHIIESNDDWKENRYRYLSGKTDFESDVEMIAILHLKKSSN